MEKELKVHRLLIEQIDWQSRYFELAVLVSTASVALSCDGVETAQELLRKAENLYHENLRLDRIIIYSEIKPDGRED